MDKFNFVRDGGSKLPPGFRFQPTDEEIVFQYLARKIFSYPLPASVIPEINVFSFDPWDLPGDSDQDRYFFSDKETNYRNINRASKATCGGYWKVTGSYKQITPHWKVTGSYKQIICSKRTPIIGIKKTLVFYKANNHHTSRTNWFMHVYCIAISGNSTACNLMHKNISQGSLIQIGKSILCHVFSKTRHTKDEFVDNKDEDTSDTYSSASSSSSSLGSDSSVLSEVSSFSGNGETS